MSKPQHIITPQGRRIAYHLTSGQGPCVVFLGGFKSDMAGTKAVFLQDWAVARGQAFLRLDYSGHGVSGGDFLDGAIGDWFEDAQAVIAAAVQGPVVLVGSSMGGWIALLLARAMPDRIAGLVGIAAAPEFTAMVAHAFRERGFSVAINDPFKGVALIARLGRPAERRHSLQVELHRGLYMDERTRARSVDFDKLQSALTSISAEIAAYVRTQTSS